MSVRQVGSTEYPVVLDAAELDVACPKVLFQYPGMALCAVDQTGL